MAKWRNTFTKRIFAGYTGNTPNFNGNVMGGNDKIDIGGTSSYPLNAFKNYSLGYMPFYQFDDNAGETPNVYNIIMDFYKYDFQTQNPIGVGTVDDLPGLKFQGNQYYGLAEVVAAQWDKECPNLTLYNRDVVYDQDFTVKGNLTIAPKQISDANYTVTPFAEPTTIFTDGGTVDRFVIDPVKTVNMLAGKSIDLLPGFDAKYGSVFTASIDPALYTCDGSGQKILVDNPNPSTPNTETKNLETKKEISFSIIPNPTTGIFTIQFTKEIQANSILQIINSFGSPVYEKKLNSNQSQQIDASSLPPGLYYVRVQSGDKIYTDKVIVE
jgi:hypothetical protein